MIMINGRKPTRTERNILIKNGLDTYKWLIQKSIGKWIQVVNKETKEEKRINL
jgi:hypothetical protein